MKRVFLFVVAMCLVVVPSIARPAHAANSPAPYVLGICLEMTGRQSSLGAGVKKGIDIALADVNASGGVNGRQLKAIYVDGESDPAKDVLHTKRFIEVDQASILVGYSGVAPTMVSIPVAEAARTPLISSGPVDSIGPNAKKWIFTVVPRQKEGSLVHLFELMLKRGSKNIAYLYIDNALGQTGLKVMEEAAKDLKVKLVAIEKYAVGSTNMDPQITHIKSAGADGLIITGNVPDTATAVKNAREQGFSGPIFSDNAIVNPEFISLVGKYGEGLVTTSLKALVAPEIPANDPQKKVAMDLYDKYVKQYGDFSLYAGHGWDQIQLVAAALKKVDPKLDPSKPADVVKIREQVRDGLEQIKGLVGQNCIFTMTPTNHNGCPAKIYAPVTIRNGKWVLYKE
ncbi:MAG: ABC transporter substrate-binding protein [Syntrophorhabdales bacterium]